MCHVHTQPMLPYACLYELGNGRGNPRCGLLRRSCVLPAPACRGARIGATGVTILSRQKGENGAYRGFTEGCKVLVRLEVRAAPGWEHEKGCIHTGLSAFNNPGAQGVMWACRSSCGCPGLSPQSSVPAARCPQYQPQQHRRGGGRLFKVWCQ